MFISSCCFISERQINRQTAEGGTDREIEND